MNDINEMLDEVVALHGAGKSGEAELVIKKILRREPENSDAIHFLGVIAYEAGRIELAKDCINKAIQLMPWNASCFNNMGNIFQLEKNFSQAVVWYEKAFEMDPGNKRTCSNLGVAYTRLGRFDEAAVSLFQKALAVDPEYAEAHNNLGEVFRHQGLFEKSLQACQRAIDLSPDWRWMTAGDVSPWYPTMKLFRQPAPGDWDAVFLQIEKALYQKMTL